MFAASRGCGVILGRESEWLMATSRESIPRAPQGWSSYPAGCFYHNANGGGQFTCFAAKLPSFMLASYPYDKLHSWQDSVLPEGWVAVGKERYRSPVADPRTCFLQVCMYPRLARRTLQNQTCTPFAKGILQSPRQSSLIT